MSNKKNNNSTPKKKRKFRFSVNPLLITVIILVLIPVSILGYSVVKSVDSRGVPVSGNRYEDELPEKLTKDQVGNLKSEISVDGMESVDVTLNAATLRVTIKVPEMTSDEEADTVVHTVYDTVDSLTPISKYFTNKDGEKSYDLEIHAYNHIPKSEEEKESQIYSILTKNGSMSEPIVNVQTTAKSDDLTYHLMNPITEEQLLEVKAAISVEGMDVAEVRYANARVIVSVKVPELADNDAAKELCVEVYDQVDSVLPIDDFFSNRGSVQRYTLEIHVFNKVAQEGEDVSDQVATTLIKVSQSDTYKLSTDESE